ncbi:MAG: MASE1 domain-containing protein [Gemmatimonadaceae bacterium]|nr:MASE1 domain-containing protein [Gemmatimonadaceae bacterium]
MATTVVGNLVLALVYFASAQLSLTAATEHRLVSSIWPPAGIALFALLRFGLWYWPGVAVAAFATNSLSGVASFGSLVIGLGNALEGVVGAYLVRRALGQRRTLSHVRDVVALMVLGGTVATVIVPTIGVATLIAGGLTTLASMKALWLVWWTGEAVGVFAVTPFLLLWSTPEMPLPPRRWRWVEAATLFLALGLLTDYLFSGLGALVFAIYPLALVIGWRHGPRAAATATVVVMLIASLRTLSGYGPFTTFTPTGNLFALQFFLALLAVKSLLFAAARTESRYSETRLAASEARYRMLAQKLPDGAVVLYDRALTLLLVEGPAVGNAGFVREELVGRRIHEIFDAVHADALGTPFRAAFDGLEVEFEFSYNHRLYLVRVLPAADADGGETLGMALALDITERELAQREIAENRAQLQQLSRLLLTAQEDERRHVAREVHDELGQALTAVKIGLSQAFTRGPRRSSLDSERRVRATTALLDRAIESVQRIVLRLRPGVLDNLGLVAALEHEVQRFHETTDIAVTLTLPPETSAAPIDGTQSTVLYRTLQEALTNVVRHAQARRVDVSLSVSATDVTLQVEDDGIGIADEQLRKPRSMGLLGMRERAASCGGRVEISRRASGGTCVRLRVPRLDAIRRASA